ncbi:hypothetical protein [Stenotrophomonas hibiscicola]|uniref:hypothetical protein n=1 Tax=Stenotrophomonas hibiscicola TaxID=86189 RepID=UPI002E78F9B5|nr:hypothetical protein [[Pseudomonas] hibiscicola]
MDDMLDLVLLFPLFAKQNRMFSESLHCIFPSGGGLKKFNNKSGQKKAPAKEAFFQLRNERTLPFLIH